MNNFDIPDFVGNEPFPFVIGRSKFGFPVMVYYHQNLDRPHPVCGFVINIILPGVDYDYCTFNLLVETGIIPHKMAMKGCKKIMKKFLSFLKDRENINFKTEILIEFSYLIDIKNDIGWR
jgi:hypothetical protein